MGRGRRRMRRGAAWIDRWDVRVSDRIARARTPAAAEVGLPLLTRAADHSVLWMTLAAGLTATGRPRLRRAAVRGLGSVAVASLLANQVGKRAVPRRRPLLAGVPAWRIASRVPVSSSFPSGHSASAAAFAVGASIEDPALALPLGALAGAVGFSRIYTGVHFPSDVLAGVAIGAAVAGVGAVLVPAHSPPARRTGSEPDVPLPPRPSGRGVIIVMNGGSGSAGDTLQELLRTELPDAELIVLDEGDDVRAALKDAAGRAEVLGVAGGDGTVRCAADVAVQAERPLLVVAGGTFNHFAKDLGLPDAADAVEAVRAGRAVRIDLGRVRTDVGEETFLNTASIGSYPQFVAVRERWEKRLGKPVAAALAMWEVLRSCPPVQATVDGVPRRLALLFVGNGQYQPNGFVPRSRPALDRARLDVRFADVSGRGSMLGLVAAALTGDLYRTRAYVETAPRELHVRVPASTLVACDGEVLDAAEQVSFAVRPQALTVYCGPAGREAARRR